MSLGSPIGGADRRMYHSGGLTTFQGLYGTTAASSSKSVHPDLVSETYSAVRIGSDNCFGAHVYFEERACNAIVVKTKRTQRSTQQLRNPKLCCYVRPTIDSSLCIFAIRNSASYKAI